MSERYFYEQIVNAIGTPLWIYDRNICLVEKIGGEEAVWWTQCDFTQSDVEKILTENKEYPVIHIGRNDDIATVIYDCKKERNFVLGPVSAAVSRLQQNELCRKKGALNKNEKEIVPYCPFDLFISGCLLLNWKVTGNELSVSELLNLNKNRHEKIRQIRRRISEDMFLQQENSGKHNPNEQELRELESIENGDEEALRRSVSEIYEGSIGILAKTPLRHHKNVAIGNITLASRAAIRGGLSVENSFSMADSMIRQVEEIRNIPEVEMFKRECKFIYAAAVKEEKKRRGGFLTKEENPIVGKAKDYIFSHLHSKIKVSDIAHALNLNPDYLSYVFSKSGNTTIKKYILEEKIRRSQNLLKYSDYQIQEISFYLGFSSQSHFTRVFCEITGMKPNDYRKKYGNREKWK